MPEENLQNFEKVRMSRKNIIINNFLGGIFWSLGTLVGAGVIIVIIGYILSKIDLIPIIGNWLGSILETSVKNRIQLPQ